MAIGRVGTGRDASDDTVMDVAPVISWHVARIDTLGLNRVDVFEHLGDLRPARDLEDVVSAGAHEWKCLEQFAATDSAHDINTRQHRAVVVGGPSNEGKDTVWCETDDAAMAVELYAPSRAIGFARVGQSVRLMYDAFPYQQFGSFAGTVAAISHTALAPGDIDAPLKLAEPAYRLRVRLDAQAVAAFGGVYPLQPGMTLKANVVLEKQSFLGWLLEPLNAVRHRT